MNILTKYLMKQTLALFCLVMPGLCSLYLLIALAEKMDELTDFGSFSVGMAYFMLLLPDIASKLLPLATLLSGLLALVLLARHSELIAMMASGISPLRIASSVLAFACAAAFVGVFFQASLVSMASVGASDIWMRYVEKGTVKGVIKNGSLYFHGADTVWSATLLKDDATLLKDVWLLRLAPDYSIDELMVAKEAAFDGEKWFFKGVLEQGVSKEAGGRVKTSSEKQIKLKETPADFVVMRKQVTDQGILELYQGIRRLEKTGLETTELRAAFWAQLFYPFLGVSMLWCGLAFVLGRSKNHLATGVTIGIGLGIGCWMFWNVLVSLASTGKIPPLLAPVLCHLLLFVMGFVSFAKVVRGVRFKFLN